MSEAVATVIGLMRSSRSGALATVADGQPFSSLVTPAAAPDRSPLLLLSGLSPHTRHLRTEPRCSLLLSGAPRDTNPQTAPRASLIARAEPAPDPGLKARWLAIHPYAAFYADLPDFQLWRLRVDAAQFVGGFASAGRFEAAALQPDPAAVAGLLKAEPDILAHCNDHHADALDAIARAHGGVQGGAEAGWRMVTCDVDGFDLACADAVRRIAWPEPATYSGDVRRHLIALAAAARNLTATAGLS